MNQSTIKEKSMFSKSIPRNTWKQESAFKPDKAQQESVVKRKNTIIKLNKSSKEWSKKMEL